MFTYTYKAVKHGAMVETQRQGLCAWVVRRALEREGYVVVRLERQRDRTGKSAPTALAHVARMPAYLQILFFRNFSMMLESGVSISHTLETLTRQMKGIGVRSALTQIRTDVQNGTPLSTAMARYSKLFPEHIRKTVEVGECSGQLAATLDKISVDIEKNFELRRKVIGAILYPLIIITFMLATAILLVVFVLPQMTAMFRSMGVPVPALTLALEKVGSFLVAYPILVVGGLLSFVSVLVVLMRVRAYRVLVHHVALRLPIFGPLVLEYNLVQFTRTITTLLSSGIRFSDALAVTQGVLRNEAFKDSIDRIVPIVLHGGRFSEALLMYPKLYPDQLVQLVIVGEQSGRLSYALEKISGHYERSVQFQTQMLTTVIEPILMLVAGILVGSLAFSMFAPLYSMTSYI